jgi:hypothetical protein
MIFAEMKGKLGSNLGRANERLEDLLTSSAIGLLRYFPIEWGLVALLRHARPCLWDGKKLIVERPGKWLDVSGVLGATVEFWPSFGEFGEPDLLIQLTGQDDLIQHNILIEAKYFSPKSSVAEDDAIELSEDKPDPDQLVKYWQGLVRRQENRSCSLIYLTSQGSPPVHELSESLRRCPQMRLAWLSWSDVWSIAQNQAKRDEKFLPAVDLQAFLEHKGLGSFDGFALTPVRLTPHGWFWTESIHLFARTSRLDFAAFNGQQISPHFWCDDEQS